MCYFGGQRAKILTVSKRKPLKGWKVLRKRGLGGWQSPLYGGTVGGIQLPRTWVQASTHGYYVMKTWVGANMAYGDLASPERVKRVEIAGKVREYASGYRAEWIRVL